jgi:hypothetical protein
LTVFLLSHFKVGRIAKGSSNQAASLYRKLKDRGYSMMLSHPKKKRYIVEAKIKSDRVDSKAIAELARLDALPLASKQIDGETIYKSVLRSFPLTFLSVKNRLRAYAF